MRIVGLLYELATGRIMRVQNSVSPGGDAGISVAFVGVLLSLVSGSKVNLAFFKASKHRPDFELKVQLVVALEHLIKVQPYCFKNPNFGTVDAVIEVACKDDCVVLVFCCYLILFLCFSIVNHFFSDVLQVFVALSNLVLARRKMAVDKTNSGFRQLKRYFERAFIAHCFFKTKWYDLRNDIFYQRC